MRMGRLRPSPAMVVAVLALVVGSVGGAVAGTVITGGSTLLAGMPEMAEEVIGMPVRRGLPRGIGGLVDVVKSPQYATAVGLVVYGARQQMGSPYFKIREENVYRKVRTRMQRWLGEIF